MDTSFHSVTLEPSLCVGCINCIKRCPTEAIRVRDGKAMIISERCIDCGECIRVCPYRAKRAKYDSLSMIKDYKYRIALPAPALYGQFNNLYNIDYILNGLIALGFDDVFEVSRAAEIVSDATRQLLESGKIKKPIINSSCPSIVRLIQVRFPNLRKHLLPIKAPMEVAAQIARRNAIEKTGLNSEDIGIFFISPCPAKVTDVRIPIGSKKSNVNGVLAISDIFPKLVSEMDDLNEGELKPLSKSGIIGVGWSSIGGESAGLLLDNHLAADGIENVINVLEDLEDDKLSELDFIELDACAGGCVGGVFTAENGYVARARIQKLRKYLPVSLNKLEDNITIDEIKWTEKLKSNPALKLADNVSEAIMLMDKIDKITKKFPMLDCGSCGAPSCRGLAEDVVKGLASENDCIFLMRKQIQDIADKLDKLGS